MAGSAYYDVDAILAEEEVRAARPATVCHSQCAHQPCLLLPLAFAAAACRLRRWLRGFGQGTGPAVRRGRRACPRPQPTRFLFKDPLWRDGPRTAPLPDAPPPFPHAQLPRNASVELPLWLFPELHARNMVVPLLPKQFRKRCVCPPLLRKRCIGAPSAASTCLTPRFRCCRGTGDVAAHAWTAAPCGAPFCRPRQLTPGLPLVARSTRDDLDAEPALARLREKCPYWFDVGMALASQCAGEEVFAGLAPFVAKAFQSRYRELLSRAHTTTCNRDQLGFVSLLTREERHGEASRNLLHPSMCVIARFASPDTRPMSWRQCLMQAGDQCQHSRPGDTAQRCVIDCTATALLHLTHRDVPPLHQERIEAAPIVRAMRRRRLSPSNQNGVAGEA